VKRCASFRGIYSIIDRVYGSTDVAKVERTNLVGEYSSIVSWHRTIVRSQEILTFVTIDIRQIVDMFNDEREILKTFKSTGTYLVRVTMRISRSPISSESSRLDFASCRDSSAHDLDDPDYHASL